MIDRRDLMLALGACALGAPAAGHAQTDGRTYRIGILSFAPAPSGTDPDPTGFDQGLRELGYLEGRNAVIERRYANGRTDRLAALAAELVQLKVDVILAGGPAPRDAASSATRTIPIVTVSGSDPVREGWAQSLAHPGGNITGLTVTYPGLPLKALEILKEASPGLARVAVLIAPTDLLDAKEVMQEMEAGARQLGLQPQGLEVRGPNDFEAAFSRARQGQAQALYAFATNIVVAHRSRLAALAVSNRLLSFSQFPLLAQAGFLMTYGADIEDLGRRSIMQMDKILKGARPGDLPIERPTKLQLSINLKTAKALGITIPQSLLLRADEVIE